MERDDDQRAAAAAVLAALTTAGVFEALTTAATQAGPVRAASPWREDPYHVVVSLTQVAVPLLAVVIALRLLVWREPGGPDRARQTVRAAGVMTALVGCTAAVEWVAVGDGAHRSSWGTGTAVLIAGLAVVSALTAAVAVLLVRRRDPAGGRWRHDWLGDAVLLCGRIPVLRRRVRPAAAAWVRRRATTVFVALSVLAALGITGAQAVGERWTDPLLIAWLLAAETACHFACCVLGNAVAGFVARPPLSRPRRVAEASAVAGCVGVQFAIAFRDGLWRSLGGGPRMSVPALVGLTLGAGAAVALATAGLLAVRGSGPPPESGAAAA